MSPYNFLNLLKMPECRICRMLLSRMRACARIANKEKEKRKISHA